MNEETKHPKIPNVVTEQDKGRCALATGSEQWEYAINRSQFLPDEERLAQRGKNGWELCCILWEQHGPGVVTYFKRRIPNKQAHI